MAGITSEMPLPQSEVAGARAEVPVAASLPQVFQLPRAGSPGEEPMLPVGPLLALVAGLGLWAWTFRGQRAHA